MPTPDRNPKARLQQLQSGRLCFTVPLHRYGPCPLAGHHGPVRQTAETPAHGAQPTSSRRATAMYREFQTPDVLLDPVRLWDADLRSAPLARPCLGPRWRPEQRTKTRCFGGWSNQKRVAYLDRWRQLLGEPAAAGIEDVPTPGNASRKCNGLAPSGPADSALPGGDVPGPRLSVRIVLTERPDPPSVLAAIHPRWRATKFNARSIRARPVPASIAFRSSTEGVPLTRPARNSLCVGARFCLARRDAILRCLRPQVAPCHFPNLFVLCRRIRNSQSSHSFGMTLLRQPH